MDRSIGGLSYAYIYLEDQNIVFAIIDRRLVEVHDY
jgi:hypothetical protein